MFYSVERAFRFPKAAGATKSDVAVSSTHAAVR
jgi:hypothetical protein